MSLYRPSDPYTSGQAHGTLDYDSIAKGTHQSVLFSPKTATLRILLTVETAGFVNWF